MWYSGEKGGPGLGRSGFKSTVPSMPHMEDSIALGKPLSHFLPVFTHNVSKSCRIAVRENTTMIRTLEIGNDKIL